MKPGIGVFFLFVLVLPVLCQTKAGAQTFDNDQALRTEMQFARHLLSRGEFNEAYFWLRDFQARGSELADSLWYLRGDLLFRQQKLDEAAVHFSRVGAESALFQAASLWGFYALMHQQNYFQARKQKQDFSAWMESANTSAWLDGLWNFQLAGFSLLTRDFDDFSLRAAHFSGGLEAFSQEEQRLLAYHRQLVERPARSAFLAGALSAVVPGLGKVYAGKPAEGVAGFLYMAALGATTWDFYRGGGHSSAWFILSAIVTATFYAGNIWGSAAAVYRSENEFQHEINQRILLDLHVPLRRLFQ